VTPGARVINGEDMKKPFSILSLLIYFGMVVTFAPIAHCQNGGWLVIHGGGDLSNEAKERFVALAGGSEARFVMIPTAMPGASADLERRELGFAKSWGLRNVTVLHTRDRALANSAQFVEPLRHASGVWIDGGRQWRLVDAYLGTAVEREIKALLARGGVVFGSSAGATIQGSFLVRGSPGTPTNPDGDNRIMVAPGYVTGFGLLTNSAIDQHTDARGREHDLDPVIAAHPELLGIGIDQSAAIVVHGDSFFVVSGNVTIHDGMQLPDGRPSRVLGPGQSFNLKTRVSDDIAHNFDHNLTVLSATRSRMPSENKTVGVGSIGTHSGGANAPATSQQINYECEVSLYSIGGTIYPAEFDGPGKLRIQAREVDTNALREYTCKYTRR
jgi:cyanophycinase